MITSIRVLPVVIARYAVLLEGLVSVAKKQPIQGSHMRFHSDKVPTTIWLCIANFFCSLTINFRPRLN